jgi:magnesium transporter
MTPSLEVLRETIKKLISRDNKRALERLLEKAHRGDIAYIFRYLSSQERIKVFEVLLDIDIEKASDVLYELDEDLQVEILRNIPLKEAIKVLLTFSTGEIAKVIDKLPKELQIGILERLEDEDRKELEKYISFGEASATHLVSEDYLEINENKTVEDALNLVKSASNELEIIYVYVVDDKERLVGVVSLKDLLVAPSNTQIKDIMTRDVVAIREDATKDEVIDIFKRYDFYALPVVDEDDKLVGVIYIDDVIDAISEKTTEEFFKMAGAQEEELFYANQVFKIAKLRLPWLFVTVIGELITAFIISIFDITIYKALPIIFFLPLIAAVGGNISSQSAIITARGLMTGKITENKKDIFMYILRELKIAFILAIFISIIVGVISFLWFSNHLIGVVVSAGILINILFSSLLGGLIPFVLKFLKKDPSFATGPIVLTLNDILGVLIYLSIASYFINKII